MKASLKIKGEHVSCNKLSGAHAKMMQGMDLDALRNEHTSKLMTKKYAKMIKEVYGK